jgi:hypothetical protein
MVAVHAPRTSSSRALDAGAVIAQSRVGIPSNFLFRTAATPPCAATRSRASACSRATRSSAAATTAVGERRSRALDQPDVGLAAFVDAGNAKDKMSELTPAVGYGVGARLSTPIGPFRLDVAYGEQAKSVRCISRWAVVLSDGTARRKPRRRVLRALRGLLGVLAIVVVAIAGTYAFLRSQAALDYVVRRAVHEAEGHLVIEGAEGSLLSTVRIARIKWTGDELDVEARDSAVTWSPFDLLSRKVNVSGLGAKRITIDFKKAESKGGLPATLALPLEVDAAQHRRRAARVEDDRAARRGHRHRLQLRRRRGPGTRTRPALRHGARHACRTARIGAIPPYDCRPTSRSRATATGRPPSAKLGSRARRAHEHRREGRATRGGRGDQGGRHAVRAAHRHQRGHRRAQSRPREVRGRAAGTSSRSCSRRARRRGFAGTLRARNEDARPHRQGPRAGPRHRIAFAWDGTTLALTASTPSSRQRAGARAACRSRRRRPVKIDLSLANVDLAQLQTSLIATRLSGTLAGEVEKERQVCAATSAGRSRARVRRGRSQGAGRRAQRAGASRARHADGQRHARPRRAARFLDQGARARVRSVAIRRRARRAARRHRRARRARSRPLRLRARHDRQGKPFRRTSTSAGTAAAHARDRSKDLALDAAPRTVKRHGRLRHGARTRSRTTSTSRGRAAAAAGGALREDCAARSARGSLRAKGTVQRRSASPAVTVDAHGASLQWGRIARAATLDVDASIGRDASRQASRWKRGRSRRALPHELRRCRRRRSHKATSMRAARSRSTATLAAPARLRCSPHRSRAA